MDGTFRGMAGASSSEPPRKNLDRAEAEMPSDKEESERTAPQSAAQSASPYFVAGMWKTKMKAISQTHIVPWDITMSYIFSDFTDVQSHMQRYLPPHSHRLHSYTNQEAYTVPEKHPSTYIWPRKMSLNTTKNCFALAASFEFKQRGSTVKVALKKFLESLFGARAGTAVCGRWRGMLTTTPGGIRKNQGNGATVNGFF
eukprot:63073-Amphidinium_carterae.3